MKFKKLLGAAAAIALSGTANAAWDYGSAVDPFGGNGELLLAVWDESASNQVSVWQDLGSSYDLFKSNLNTAGFTQSFSLDASVFSALSSSDPADLRYAVIAFDKPGFEPVQGFLTTTNAASPNAPAAQVNNAINIAVSNLQPTVNGTDTNYATNNAFVGLPGANQYAGDNGILGRNLKQSQFFDITAGVEEELGFWNFLNDDSSAKALGTWSIDLGTNSLTYASAVPIPAAGWLLGSALAGFAAIARRRRS